MMLHATIGLARVGSFPSRDQDALAAGLDQEQPGIIQAPLAKTFCRKLSKWVPSFVPKPKGPLGTKLGVLVDKEIKKVVLSSGDAEKERECNEASKTSGS